MRNQRFKGGGQGGSWTLHDDVFSVSCRKYVASRAHIGSVVIVVCDTTATFGRRRGFLACVGAG